MPDAREDMPLFPLGTVLFPGGPVALRIFEPRYVDMVRECVRGDRPFGVILIREGEEAGPAVTHDVGTAAYIRDWDQLEDGLLGITAWGDARFRVAEVDTRADGLQMGTVAWLPPEPARTVPEAQRPLVELLRVIMRRIGNRYGSETMDFDNAAWVGYRLCELLPISTLQRQYLLELQDPVRRLEILHPLVESLQDDA